MKTTLKLEAFICPYTGERVQALIRHRFIFGICVSRKEIDREIIPAWALIQNATLGSTEWKSKFADIAEVWPSRATR